MSSIGQTVVCRACNKQVRIDQVTLDPVKKVYICTSCYSRAHPSTASVSKTAPVETKPGIFGGKKPTTKEVIIKYACLSCKYKWSKKSGKEVTKCPYCGGVKIEEVSNEAAKILADSDNFGF